MTPTKHFRTTASIILTLFAIGDATAATGQPTTEALYDLQHGFLLKPFSLAGYFSSYDRTGGNDDGFKGTWSSLYQLDNGQHVIVDLNGPGCLYTLWFTGPQAGYDPSWGPLRFYLDNEQSPRLEIAGRDLFNGDNPLFPRPLVADEFISTGGSVAHVPIPFRDRLIITSDNPVGFYNAYYHSFPAGTPIESWPTHQNLSPAIEAFRTAGSEQLLPPGARRHSGTAHVGGKSTSQNDPSTAELLNLTGPGVISAIYLNPTRSLTAETLNNLRLRCWWDNESAPSVDVPIGPFFGSGQGEAAVRSLPLGMSPSGPFYCYFRMPFSRAARVTIESRTPGLVADIYYEIVVEKLPESPYLDRQGKFCAVFNSESPTRQGLDYTLLDLDNTAGLYLGHVLIVEPVQAGNARWWEGDLRIRTDGMRHPFLNGTGHEDELLGGWSTRWLDGPYSLPLHGLPSVQAFPIKPGRKHNGAMTGYRFFAGGIPFRKGIKVTTEHGMANEVLINYASVAYYYSASQSKLKMTDRLDLGDADSRNAHAYTSDGGQTTPRHEGVFDGDAGLENISPLSGTGRVDQKAESFSLRIDPANEGVLLRRLFHQSYGKHRARILVDGRSAGFIHYPDDNRVDRWRQADVILPANFTKGKSSIQIRIEPFEGSYNAFTYEAWTIGQ